MKKTLFERITDALDTSLDLESAETALKKFGTIKFVDEKIDEGIDDEDCEDEYLMLRTYDFVSKDGIEKYYIKLYYGNNTEELTYFTIN